MGNFHAQFGTWFSAGPRHTVRLCATHLGLAPRRRSPDTRSHAACPALPAAWAQARLNPVCAMSERGIPPFRAAWAKRREDPSHPSSTCATAMPGSVYHARMWGPYRLAAGFDRSAATTRVCRPVSAAPAAGNSAPRAPGSFFLLCPVCPVKIDTCVEPVCGCATTHAVWPRTGWPGWGMALGALVTAPWSWVPFRPGAGVRCTRQHLAPTQESTVCYGGGGEPDSLSVTGEEL